MKCDRVLSSLVTGGAVARWRARRHVARCHRCAEVHKAASGNHARARGRTAAHRRATSPLDSGEHLSPPQSTGQAGVGLWRRSAGRHGRSSVPIGLMLWLPQFRRQAEPGQVS